MWAGSLWAHFQPSIAGFAALGRVFCPIPIFSNRAVRGTQTLSRRARRFRDAHARLSLPPVNGRGTPVVPGRLSGRLFTDRMAR